MPIIRVADKDATIRGVYTAALRQLDNTRIYISENSADCYTSVFLVVSNA